MILSFPVAGSLLGLVIKFLLDDIAHQRAKYLQEQQNSFELGATSHMAQIAFDKHVDFCEQYVAEAHRGLQNLFEKGPNEEALTYSRKLGRIRQDFALWLTDQIEKDLAPFEKSFAKIGSGATVLQRAQRMQARPESLPPNLINEMYRELAGVMGFPQWQGEEITDDVAVSNLVHILRRILGTESLSNIRAHLLKKALSEFD